MSHTRRIWVSLALAIIALLLLLPNGVTAADNPNSLMLPRVYLPAVSYSIPPPTASFTSVPPEPAWTAAWWQWTERLGSTPVYEQGNVDCSQGQSGTPWFLAGSDGSQPPVLRGCTVPAGKTLLVPLHTVAWHNEPWEHLNVAEKRSVLSAIYSDTEPGDLYSKICRLESNISLAKNGQPVGTPVDISSTRLQSPTFRRFGDSQAVSDGYWFAIQLPAGQYVLYFAGILCDFDSGFPMDWDSVQVTYVLDVN